MIESRKRKNKSYVIGIAFHLIYWALVFIAIALRRHVLDDQTFHILTALAGCGVIYVFIRMSLRRAEAVQQKDSSFPKDEKASKNCPWYVLVCFLALIPLAVIQYFILEYPSNPILWNVPLNLIVLTCFLWYSLSVIILLLLNSLKCTVIVSSVLTLFLSLVFYYVELFRGEPLQFLDIYGVSTAMDVAGGYRLTFGQGPSVVIILTMMVVGVALAGAGKKVFCSGIGRVVIRITACAMAVLLFLGIIKLDWQSPLGMTVKVFNVKWTYNNYGTVLGFAGLAKSSICTPPEGYSKEVVREVADSVKDGRNQDNGLVIPENLIVIMNESWTDYSTLGEVHTNVPVLPYYESLSENVVKGHVLVPTLGGGTIKTEYEFLTGNSELQINNRYPFPLFRDHQYSIATTMRQQGYTTIAMHPHNIYNWRRDVAYAHMDFDDFYDLEDFDENVEKFRGFVSDKANYDKLIREIESRNKNGEKVFMFDVTVQNHGGYDDETFESNVYVTDFDDDGADQYFTLAHMTDEALEYLIEYYKSYDVPTMILMFGDHYPRLSTEFNAHVNPAYGAYLEGESSDSRDRQGAYYTPFFIWANYDIEPESGVELSSNYLSTYLLEHTGLRMTPYNYYLSNLRKQIPQMSAIGYVDIDGEYHPWTETDEETAALITEYECLQYNELIDTDHRLDDFFSLE